MSEGMGHDAGPRGRHSLSAAQDAALAALARGDSVTTAAKRAGVARQTVSVWAHRDPLFREALEARRSDASLAYDAALRLAASQAVDTLRDLLESPDARIRTAAAKVLLGAVKPLRDSTRPDPAPAPPPIWETRGGAYLSEL